MPEAAEFTQVNASGKVLRRELRARLADESTGIWNG